MVFNKWMSVWLLQFFPHVGGSEMISNNIYTLLLCFDRILKYFVLLLELKHDRMSLIKITMCFLGRTIFRHAPCIVLAEFHSFLFPFQIFLFPVSLLGY